MSGRSAEVPLGQPPFEEGQVEALAHQGWGRARRMDPHGRRPRRRGQRRTVPQRRPRPDRANRLAHELRAAATNWNAPTSGWSPSTPSSRTSRTSSRTTSRSRCARCKPTAICWLRSISAQLGTDGFEYINHLIQASRRLRLHDRRAAQSEPGRPRYAIDAGVQPDRGGGDRPAETWSISSSARRRPS